MGVTFWQTDFPVFLMAALSGFSCALLGSFLLVRREVMLGDALSHAVLPGIAAGYLLTGIIAPPVMLAGALAACFSSVQLTKLIERYGRFDKSTAMGISFTTLFALGVVLIEKFVGGRVHLDVEHALYGAIELTYWSDPGDLLALPSSIWAQLYVCVAILAFIALFFRPMRLACFDPDYACSVGVRTYFILPTFYMLVIAAIVTSFQAVGAILVIALLTCPAAAAYLICRDFKKQLLLSAVFGVVSGILGYIFAGFVPLWLGYNFTLSAAGMIAVVSGLLVLAASVKALKINS